MKKLMKFCLAVFLSIFFFTGTVCSHVQIEQEAILDQDGKQVSTRSMDNCESINPTAILLDGSLTPDVIPIPGESLLSANLMFTKNMPTDLYLQLNITKLQPFVMPVPCFGTIGSCSYDVCRMLANGTICAIFPPELPCSCPLIKGAFQLPPVPLRIPNLGPTISPLMRGDYIGQAKFYSKSNPDLTLGCLEFRFKLTA